VWGVLSPAPGAKTSPNVPVSGRAPKRFPGFAARAGELGAAYAVIELALNVGRRGVAAMEDRLLAIEARRAEYDWSAGGEEWTESAAWKDGLIQEILAPGVPKESVVVEIGPGAGRWSAVLRDRVARLILVEPSEAMLAVTRARFEGDPGVSWVLSDGASLPGVEDASVDAVWSFDVFVHLSANDVAGYLGEIARVLRPGGGATVHHAGRRERRARRGPMSALLFANLARERGLDVERQFDSWGGGRHDVKVFGDVITVLRRPSAPGLGPPDGPPGGG